jgi:predicted nucleic acid-binding protein
VKRFLLDSDVVIRLLRGQRQVLEHVERLAGRGQLLVSAITRAEVTSGMRPEEERATVLLLDGLTTMPVSGDIADRAGRMLGELRRRGITVHLPDAIIAATALHAEAELHTCNPRHYPDYDIALVAVKP